jgi:Peptidase A4 family
VTAKLTALLLLGALALLAGASSASADTITSSNWAGYAVHRSGVSFSRVSGAWRQPRTMCTPGRTTFSAMWVGIGGYSTSSPALSQIGTEVDCGGSGRVVSSAWYEQVPAASRPIHLRVKPGDLLFASVTITGHRVQLSLSDATSHRSFVKSLQASDLDTSSAEWILEAPSECVSPTACQTLPLANFGSARFTSASARSATGHVGAIADGSWGATRIRLTPGGRRFVVLGAQSPGGGALPSNLSRRGSSFVVRYARVVASARAAAATRSVRAGQLFHGGRW